MNYFKPSKYQIENALLEVCRYEGIYVGDDYVIKDYGSHISIYIDADNKKGHISFDLYFDENGKLKNWEKHRSN